MLDLWTDSFELLTSRACARCFEKSRQQLHRLFSINCLGIGEKGFAIILCFLACQTGNATGFESWFVGMTF